MDIVLGRGRRRQVITLPHGSVMAASAKEDPQAYKKGLADLCTLLGVRQN